MNRPLLYSFGVIALSLPLGACTHPTTVTGKVIQGDVNFVGAVDPSDARLKGAGIAGAELNARGTGTRTNRILSDTHSDSSGSFTLRMEDRDAVSFPAEFRAKAAGYGDARQEMDIPAPDQRLLVVLKPLGAVPPPPKK